MGNIQWDLEKQFNLLQFNSVQVSWQSCLMFSPTVRLQIYEELTGTADLFPVWSLERSDSVDCITLSLT